MVYLSPEYRAYIGPPRSPEWELKRQKKLRKVGYRCEKCRRHKEELQYGVEWLEVHHLTYARFRHEFLRDLQVLCNTCHTKVTRRTRRSRKIKKYLGI